MAQFYDALPTDYLAQGETMTVSVDGFPVAVANVDGEYFAFQNLCPHQPSVSNPATQRQSQHQVENSRTSERNERDGQQDARK